MTGVLSLEFKGIFPLYLPSGLCRLLSHSEGSSCSSSAWCLGSTPHTPLFLAFAPPVDHGGGNSMATGFPQWDGAERCSATACVQSVLWAEFWEQTQHKLLSAWQWMKEEQSSASDSGPEGSSAITPPTASCLENHTPVSDR